ncbi:16192_t:CDS:2 [Dentiscutata heterogama]|uniref:16192_t:CDS:1 n=1 Tax=Dentiscutata heterogama TaxID=1316150 RepID=A0ACA9KI72_9GLOM|nr:16192_t:CDS:2 [Dentiscutata heterogama]
MEIDISGLRNKALYEIAYWFYSEKSLIRNTSIAKMRLKEITDNLSLRYQTRAAKGQQTQHLLFVGAPAQRDEQKKKEEGQHDTTSTKRIHSVPQEQATVGAQCAWEDQQQRNIKKDQ